ncbi:MMPL family transporter [Bacillus sp. UNCCL81]|uniref:MMPL family transporter n=1 Tax=Bacillus sp. UNCCL81 TaxID=1502755 RepID=UPI0008EBA63A|nr:MMPL family transporter [Bacillus sp. UNCCL81]SFD38622.1 putative drug exporter of the RND superfamily [Bacillus sp. UNCCL81]
MKQHPFHSWGKFVSSKRTRWITLLVWVLLTVVLSFTFPSVNEVENNTADNLPKQTMSQKADQLIKKEFPTDSGNPLLIVWNRKDGLKEEDYKVIQTVYKELRNNPLKNQLTSPSYDLMPIQAIKRSSSEDGTTIITAVLFDKKADDEVLQKNINLLEKQIKNNTGEDPIKRKLTESGLKVRFSGPVGIQTDAVSLFSQADVKLLLSTVSLVLVFLILLYRSPIMAIVPLIVVGFAYGIVNPLLGVLGDKGIITVDSQAVSIMTVLLFGAGTDYCLFLISRYREYLLLEENKYKAIQLAIRESSGAISMSALTVVIGLGTLLFAQYGAFHRFAIPFSLAVLIMGIAAITILPALLSIFGRVSFFPFIPRTEEMEALRAEKKGKSIKKSKIKVTFNQKIGKLVTHKPWTIILVSIILLGGLALFVPRVQYTYDLLQSFPKDMPSREGFDLISDHYSSGLLAPVKVIIDTENKNIPVKKELESLSFVKDVSEPITGKDNKKLQLYEISLVDNPYSIKGLERIPQLEKKIKKLLKEYDLQKVDQHYWIGGETVTNLDTKNITERDESVIIPVMIGLIALLLLTYLRSFTAMIYLILTVILSYLSALGAGWLILHYGFGASAIQGSIPLYSFVFLVALGEDYNIFMVSEIWKNKKKQTHREAVSNGVAKTGAVISSAGLILAGTFLVLATLPIQVLVQFGIVTCIGVLIDTFIVRPLLVPAITTVLGRFAYWPGELSKKEYDSKLEMQIEK